MSESPGPGPGEWAPWSPEETAGLLDGCGAEWAVAGGWALDLARGAQSRPHKDIEIVVGEAGFAAVRAKLSAYPFYAAADGQLAPLGEGRRSRQHWVLDPPASKWRLDVMIEPGDERCWVYRRDPRITAARAEAVARSSGGVPYLRPHIVLLFKAGHARAVDERDFAASLDLLEPRERQWLRDAIRLTAPGHRWLERLE